MEKKSEECREQLPTTAAPTTPRCPHVAEEEEAQNGEDGRVEQQREKDLQDRHKGLPQLAQHASREPAVVLGRGGKWRVGKVGFHVHLTHRAEDEEGAEGAEGPAAAAEGVRGDALRHKQQREEQLRQPAGRPARVLPQLPLVPHIAQRAVHHLPALGGGRTGERS